MGETQLFNFPWPDPATSSVRNGAAAIQALAEKVAEKMWLGRADLVTLSGSLVATTSAGADVDVIFPAGGFTAAPDVVACNGEPGLPIITAPWSITGAHCYVNCKNPSNGAPQSNSPVRVNWMATGTPV